MSGTERQKLLSWTPRNWRQLSLSGKAKTEQMQHLCEALAAGEASAVADFMASETQRKLQDVLALRV